MTVETKIKIVGEYDALLEVMLHLSKFYNIGQSQIRQSDSGGFHVYVYVLGVRAE